MTMTRAELITLSENMADAVSSERWSATLKDQLLGQMHWAEWRNILNANADYRLNQVTVTLDSDGRFAKSDLTTGSGDDKKTLYRIRTVRLGQYFYQPSSYPLHPIPTDEPFLQYCWYEYDTEVQVLPPTAGNQPIVVCNWIPQRADLLSASSVTVPFPDGYELMLAYQTARHMLNKGAAEAAAAAWLTSEADKLRNDMMEDLRRLSTRPQGPIMQDSPEQWGG